MENQSFCIFAYYQANNLNVKQHSWTASHSQRQCLETHCLHCHAVRSYGQILFLPFSMGQYGLVHRCRKRNKHASTHGDVRQICFPHLRFFACWGLWENQKQKEVWDKFVDSCTTFRDSVQLDEWKCHAFSQTKRNVHFAVGIFGFMQSWVFPKQACDKLSPDFGHVFDFQIHASGLPDCRLHLHYIDVRLKKGKDYTDRGMSRNTSSETDGISFTIADLPLQWQKGFHQDSVFEVLLLCFLSCPHVGHLFSCKITTWKIRICS